MGVLRVCGLTHLLPLPSWNRRRSSGRKEVLRTSPRGGGGGILPSSRRLTHTHMRAQLAPILFLFFFFFSIRRRRPPAKTRANARPRTGARGRYIWNFFGSVAGEGKREKEPPKPHAYRCQSGSRSEQERKMAGPGLPPFVLCAAVAGSTGGMLWEVSGCE